MTAHQPVLLPETTENLQLELGNVAVDATCGGGSFALEIAKSIGANGLLILMDQDEAALEIAKQKLAHLSHVRFVHKNFRDLTTVLRSFEIEHVDAICADLGVAGFHFDDRSRGFSFHSEAVLDARMDRRGGITAADLLATADEAELGRILRDYGEEYRWRALARAILAQRETGEPFTGLSFRALIHRIKGKPRKGQTDPATQAFQALRIAVNDELGALEEFLPAATEALAPGGRLAVISYHSLEDRRVKNFIRDEEKDCICPPKMPVCRCEKVSRLARVTRKPIVPSEDELRRNPRSRSAKLRVAERK
jgi:16S rRNA (cytosine1402-N4)-methyltransferase